MSERFLVENITEPPVVECVVREGAVVGVNPALALRLKVAHRVRHRLDVRSPNGRDGLEAERRTNDTPAWLDENGIAREGERLPRRAIVIRHPVEGEVSFAGGDGAEVESALRTRGGLPDGFLERIEVVVRWPGPLSVGDTLVEGDRQLGVVEAIVNDWSADPHLYLPGETGSRSARVSIALPTAAERSSARAMGGPYWPGRGWPINGEPIRPAQLESLATTGRRAIFSDFCALKIDSTPTIRQKVHEKLLAREPIPSPRELLSSTILDGTVRALRLESPVTAPELGALSTTSLALIVALAHVAGFKIEERPRADKRRVLAISLSPPGDATDWSRGSVRTPDGFNRRTLKPEPNGLFCARIFGPMKNYECTCGRYRGERHRGIVCEKCGVEVTDSGVRQLRFGHIRLACPVVPAHLRLLVAAILGWSVEAITDSIAEDGGTVLESSLETTTLAERLGDLEAGSRDHLLVDRFAKTGLKPTSLLWKTLPVLPPDLRPMVSVSDGRTAMHNLNDLYKRVIDRSNRVSRMTDWTAPDVILASERARLVAVVDDLLHNGAGERPAAEVDGRRLLSILPMLRDTIRDPAPKRSDFSARAVVVVDPERRGGRAAVPLSLLAEMGRPTILGMIQSRGLATGIRAATNLLASDRQLRRMLTAEAFISRPMLFGSARCDALEACAVEPGLDAAVHLPPELANRLVLSAGDEVSLFMPLSDEAAQEAIAMATPGAVGAAQTIAMSWLVEVGNTENPGDMLLERALEGAEDPCEHPRAAALAGGY